MVKNNPSLRLQNEFNINQLKTIEALRELKKSAKKNRIYSYWLYRELKKVYEFSKLPSEKRKDDIELLRLYSKYANNNSISEQNIEEHYNYYVAAVEFYNNVCGFVEKVSSYEI